MIQRNKVIKNREKTIWIVLIVCIFLYPFINSFFGIDLGDTGIHMYSFERLFTQTDNIGFTSYFTTFVGWCWMKVFGGLGLWGLNLLEVLVEMLMSVLVYRTLSPILGKNKTLVGILLSIMAIGTYLNVFNYHQFNVLLLVAILCSELIAIREDKRKFSFIAGICFATVVFSRMGSVTAFVTFALYFIWYLIQDKKVLYLIRHLFSFILGAIITTGAMVGLLLTTHQLDNFVNNVFRLSNLAVSSDSGYGMNNLLTSFFEGNLDAIASGVIFVGAFLLLLIGIDVFMAKTSTAKRKIFNILVSIVIVIVALYQFIYAYDVNPAPSWPQMTTGPAFTIGVMYVVAFIGMAYHFFAKKGNQDIAMACVASILLPLLTIAGSNTGTKHVVQGMWLIAPICAYVILSMFEENGVCEFLNKITETIGLNTKKCGLIITLCIAVGCFGFKFAHMVYYTNNFDSVDRSEINSKIDNDKLKYLYTTEREADAVNGILGATEKYQKEGDRPLIVYGGSILLYSLTDMDSYTQPWFTNSVYNNEKLLQDMEKAKNEFDKLPVIIYGRTYNYYGFYEYNYEELITRELYNDYGGKRDILLGILQENNYKMQYINDYYMLFVPESDSQEQDMEYDDYIGNIVGE